MIFTMISTAMTASSRWLRSNVSSPGLKAAHPIGENEITLYTSKDKKQRLVAIIPFYDALRTLLDAIPRRSTSVLTNTRARPWTTDGFGTSFDDAKIAAKIKPDPTVRATTRQTSTSTSMTCAA